jgi:membrane protease YdiL (CAAX protease family)
MLPGFNNLIAFDKIQFSSDSAPFTMYLNFDKAVVGILIYLFLLEKRESVSWQRKDSLITLKTFATLLVFMLPLALVTHYVRIDPKLPPQTWLWALNNLFFVCFAEESIFRGLIQGGLTNLASAISRWKWLPLVLSSMLFGLDHYEGGLPYILLAAFAGVFYGYTYWKTNKLRSSILVHFGLNLTHFLLFSYPSLIAVH